MDALLEPGLPPVLGDRNQLRQVIHNLLQNAQDALAGSENPRIEVSTSRNLNEAVLAVSDNGPGIPETIQKRVFEPYVTTKAKGTGLGLAIVKKIVEEHAGRTFVENNKPRGTVVKIILPFGQSA
jgi:signal transduction histidine kinase